MDLNDLEDIISNEVEIVCRECRKFFLCHETDLILLE